MLFHIYYMAMLYNIKHLPVSHNELSHAFYLFGGQDGADTGCIM